MQESVCNWRRLWLVSLLLAGCSRAPSGVAPPAFDPVAATERAFSEYDVNNDRKLSAAELKACPGLLAALRRFDSDGDGSMSTDELQSNLQDFKNQGAGLVAVSCVVKYHNQPLEGATVKLAPEAFLGDAVKPASGITAPDGTTSLSIADEELPQEYRGRVQGVQCGVYRVVVEHSSVAIPAKYGTQTELGRIVARRDHDALIISF